jgi:uncharacterized membrane protein YccC
MAGDASLKFLERAHFWQAARILGACALAWAAAGLIGLSEYYWALVTAVVVTQPAFHETLSASRDRLIGTLIGAFAGLAVIAAGQRGVSTFALFWVAMVPLAMLTARKPNLRLCCITLVIVVLVPSSGGRFARPLERIIEILVGCLASVVVSAATPSRGKTEGE